jgi:hypothetical protein
VATASAFTANTTAGSYTVSASVSGVATPASFSLTNKATMASKLAFIQQPGGAAAGSAFLTQPWVAVEDTYGNVIATDTSSVTLTLNPAPGANKPKLQNCASTNSGGITTFSGCSINQAGNGYSLNATDGALTSATSNTFNVSGGASQLVFTTSPSNSTGGIAFPTQPVVIVEDSSGNVVYNDNHTLTLSITTGTPNSGGPGALSGCSQTETNGVVTFSGCSINTAGTGYKLTASAGGQITTATSNAFNVAVGAASQLVLKPASTTPTAGAADNLTITAADAGGNPITSYTGTHNLTFSGASNAPDGTPPTVADSSGTAQRFGTGIAINFSNGVATVSGSSNGVMKLYNAGSASIVVSDGTLTNGTGLAVTVSAAAASKLAFTQQPSGSSGGVAFATQPKVAVQDQYANTVTNNGSKVTLAITSGTGTTGASLSCTTNPLAASGGVASFSGCKIDKAGTGYTLTATDGTLTSATSSSFDIALGAAAKVVFTQQPSSSTGGIAFATQPRVAVEDAGGNIVSSDSSNVTLAIGTNPGGGTLTCTSNPLAGVGGVAAFSGCTIDKAGNGYTLIATDGSLTSATSSSFNITVGPAAKLAFTQQPAGAKTGIAFVTQPKVAIQDAGGNTVTTNSSSVTLAITSGAGTSGAGLNCTTNPLAATSGVVSFSGCAIDTTGPGYTLTATDGSLSSATSSSFDVLTPVTASKVTSATNTTTGTTATALNTATSSVSTTSATTYLVLVQHEDQTTSGITASVTGPFAGISQLGSTNHFQNNSYLYAFVATGNGSSGAVNVAIGGSGASNQATVVEVIKLSGNNTTTPVVQAVNKAGTNNSATASLSSPSTASAEVVLVGMQGTGAGGATINAPSGYSALDTTQFGGASGGWTSNAYVNSTAQASSSFSLSQSKPWGTIAIEINHS